MKNGGKDGQNEDKDRQENKEKKEKKQKIVYIDDGSTVADMSGTFKKKRPPRQKSTAKEKMRTYFSVVKKMILPMLCTLLAFTLVYFLFVAIVGHF